MAAPAAPTARVAAAAPATTCIVTRVLSWPLTVQGDTGERVRTIQWNLNAQIGAGLSVDGVFGPLTRNAVIRFQQICRIQVDGKVGNQTWPRLLPQIQQGSTGQSVVALQHSLRFVYGFNIAVDGIFGPQTKAAVVAFQQRFHIGRRRHRRAGHVEHAGRQRAVIILNAAMPGSGASPGAGHFGFRAAFSQPTMATP